MSHQPVRPRSSSRPSSRPSSCSSRSGNSRTTGTSKHTGDSNQRVTVPLPRSIHELQNRAAKLFGHNGKLRMFHHGMVPIHDPSQLSNIKDGDVVVITWDDRRLTKGEFAELLQTTNQRDFVKHPLSKPVAPVQSAQSNLPLIHHPFEGATSYTSEYVKHPLAKREPVEKPWQPSRLRSPQKGQTGSSSYADEYPWHDVCLSDTRQRHLSRDAPRPKSEPFVGCTSYMQDYVKPPPQPKRVSTPSRPRPRTANMAPFQGQSTYLAEYTEKALPTLLAKRPNACDDVAKKPVPFEGSSDYQQNFIQHKEIHPMIHLEPEMFSPTSSTR